MLTFFLVSSKCFTIEECIGYRNVLTGTYCCVSSFGFAECFTFDALCSELCFEVQINHKSRLSIGNYNNCEELLIENVFKS
jgi:hypothetical protein